MRQGRNLRHWRSDRYSEFATPSLSWGGVYLKEHYDSKIEK